MNESEFERNMRWSTYFLWVTVTLMAISTILQILIYINS